MKKLLFVILLSIGISTTTYSQWTTNDNGIYPLTVGDHVSIRIATPDSPVEFTVFGKQIIYGPQATLLFGGLENTTFGWGEYGIEYNVADGGLNFWKPFGNTHGSTKNNILFLKDDGKVGIGTATPSDGFLLTVAGGINAQEILVTETAGGADFVFEDDYKLKTLFDVEEYIKQNKHLPEIPSAQQMEQDGINMGELQIKLLQKVEELTLYIIQQQKEIETLKAKMED